jgi:hypothetical protein
MALPILTLDKRVLNPRFGYVFERGWLQPYESIVGMLWKFVRVNAMPGYAAVMHLIPQATDPYAGIDPSEVDVALVARLLGITQKSVRAGLPNGQPASRHLRYCERCLRRGYHSRLHQQLRHERCPIHGELLRTTCRHCGQTSTFRLDAQMLDAPFRCRHCRAYRAHGGTKPAAWHCSFTLKERISITRSAVS